MTHDERQKFEHELIDRKLTWLLTSQTILFASLAFVLGNEGSKDDKFFFTLLISCLGIVISLLIFIGVLMGIRAKRKDFENEAETKKINHPQEYERHPVQWGVDTKNTEIAIIPDKFMPVVFAMAWLIILLWKLF